MRAREMRDHERLHQSGERIAVIVVKFFAALLDICLRVDYIEALLAIVDLESC